MIPKSTYQPVVLPHLLHPCSDQFLAILPMNLTWIYTISPSSVFKMLWHKGLLTQTPSVWILMLPPSGSLSAGKLSNPSLPQLPHPGLLMSLLPMLQSNPSSCFKTSVVVITTWQVSLHFGPLKINPPDRLIFLKHLHLFRASFSRVVFSHFQCNSDEPHPEWHDSLQPSVPNPLARGMEDTNASSNFQPAVGAT